MTRLGLEPHPEGGFYREVYRSPDQVSRDGVQRSAATTIYFLLTAGGHGRWHVVGLDEVWHFLAGDPLELLTYDPVRQLPRKTVLAPPGDASGGPDAQPVAVVPRDVWQAARTLGAYSLVGCTVAPGFDFADFRFVAELADSAGAFEGPLAEYRGLL